MMLVEYARFAGRLLGRRHNVYTDKESVQFRTMIRSAQLDVTLGDFSAGAILAFIIGVLIGAACSVGVMAYTGSALNIYYALTGGIVLGVILFVIFRQAPRYAYYAAVRDIERNLITFLSFLRGCAMSGIPLEKMIAIGAEGDFGHLSKELKKIMGLTLEYADLTRALEISMREIDSPFYRSVVSHLIRIRQEGLEFVPGRPLREQPIALAMNTLAEEHIHRFRTSCQTFTSYAKQIMVFMTLFCVVLPALLTILIIVGSIINPLISANVLKLLLIFIFPAVTGLIIYNISKKEPR